MKFKWMMLAVLLVCLFAISAVSAADNTTSDVVSVEKTATDAISVDEAKEVVSVEKNQVILKENNTVGTFDELSSLIENTTEGTTLELKKDYKYVNGSTEGIQINKLITINGKGHTLDGNHLSRIFYLTADNIVLKNMTFINGYTSDYPSGGAILNYNVANCSIISCNFKDCSAKDGGAIYNYGIVDSSIISCNFNDCSADHGGAIYDDGVNCSISLCNFSNCSSIWRADVIYIGDVKCNIASSTFTNCSRGYDLIYNYKGDLNLNSCTFHNCNSIHNAGNDGDFAKSIITSCIFNNWSTDEGAIYNTEGVNCIINSCTFNNGYSSSRGAAIYNDDGITRHHRVTCTINSCNFNNCSAKEKGGAIYNYGVVDCSISSCNFNNCSAKEEGGAIYYYDNNDKGNVRTIKSCTFNNCVAGEGGAVYNKAYINYGYKDNWNLNLKSCTFNNCVAGEGGAIKNDNAMCTIDSCTFRSCSAKEKAGAVYNTDIKCIIDSSTFTSCSANDGGAIYTIGGECNIYSNIFNKCSANNNAASIYVISDYNIAGCKFSGFRENELYPMGITTTDCIFLLETSISASNVATVYNGGKYLTATLKDSTGKKIGGVKVTVVLGGKTYNPTTNKNGQVKVSTNGLAPVKTYVAKITFNGNSKYDKSTKSVKINVNKANPKLTAAKKTFKRTVKVKNYAVVLKTNQNKALKSVWVSLKVNKKTYKVKTNSRGQAIFKINNLAKKGTFNAIVKFAGNKYYNAKTVNTKITVK